MINKVLVVTGEEDCNSKPAFFSGNGKPSGSDPEGALAKESSSTLTKQAFVVDDFHNASSPFMRDLDNDDKITKSMNEFDLSNLQESNHELEDGSQFGSEDRNKEDSVDAATNGVITWESVTRNMASTTVMSPQSGSFVIRKHDRKTSLTLFVRTDPEDKTKLFEGDVSDLSSLNCKDPSWHCWDTIETEKSNTDKQVADCLTKNLEAENFAKAQQMMCGWHFLIQSLTLCETSLHFIATSFKRECCWNVPRHLTQWSVQDLVHTASAFMCETLALKN